MPLLINEEQSMLKESAKDFLKSNSPVSALRSLRDKKSELGYDVNIWKKMVEIGWTGLTIPEEYGGLNFGYVGFGQILEETGRTLAASPLLSNVLLGAATISIAGNEKQKEKILPAIASGELLVTLAIDEKNRHQPDFIAATAFKHKDGKYELNGKKVFVLDGHIADQYIVLAQSSYVDLGQALYLIDAKTEGIKCTRNVMMDGRNVATLEFDEALLPEENLIGAMKEGPEIIEKVLDIARIGLSAEMLGSMQEAFERTMSYLRERQQFGVFIGSFQALQHRSAKMYCEIELCKSMVINALQAIDKEADNLPELASTTKAKVGETLKLVTNECIQMYGGIGMTDDEEIGFFLKRARVADQTFGDVAFHLDRYAKIRGY